MEENKTASKRSALIWASIILAALAALAAVLVKYWRVRQAHLLTQERKPAPPPQPIHAEIQGLTAAEADARRGEAQDNLIQLQPRRTTKEILRYNTLSIFNLSLVGIAFVQLLLGQPLDALLSLGVMLLNIGLNTAQELIAKRRLRDLKTATQPSVTVIRDDAAQSIDPNEIVVGDALVAGPGDYIFVDGEVMGEGHLVMNESLLSTSSDTPTKREGDPVYAGSYCLSGRAVYITQKVGQDRKISKLLSELQTGKEELTPLESIINRILKVLLAIVAIFTFILLATYFRLDLGIPSEVIIDATSVIFSIAPASLFFMILLTYAGGTADLAKLGALVHRARSVESLAQIDTICFAREGVLTGTHVEIEDLQPPDGNSRVAESRLRQILGDYARSTSLDNFAVRAMANSFEGNRREILTEAPFLAVFGWSAVTFDHNDLRGLYVLGVPATMETYLIAGSEETAEIEPDAQPKEPSSLKRMTTGIGKLFRRNKNEEPDEQTDSDNQAQPETDPTDQLEERGDPDTENTPEDESPKPNIFKRMFNRVGTMLQREDETPPEDHLPEEEGEQQVELLFAYLPEPGLLHDSSGAPQLPDNLIPLCRLRYSEVVNYDAIKTIKDFQGSGVSIKVFSAGNPDTIATLLVNAGFSSIDGSPPEKISGEKLSSLDQTRLSKAADENDIFGHLTPVQSGQIVQALRQDGQNVAVLGDGVNDIPALRQATLAITRQSSSQATLSIADIIVLDDSPQALQRVLNKGQRILTGLLDILKLYLTQAFYLALLIPAILILSNGFPFKSIQNTVIATISVTIPAVGLTFWAAARVFESAKLSSILAHFVAPAAITMSAAAFIVYQFFLTRLGDIEYAQLTVTYTLVLAGLLLVIFVRPTTRIFAGGSQLTGDWRPTWLVTILLFAYILVVSIPLTQELLKIGWLREPAHYLYIMLVVSGWAFTLRLIWRIWPLERTKV